MYDANGQLAADRIYGGYPNPMEVASPIEIGPKRRVVKPYLDRKITPWGHGVVNTARRETVAFEANAVKEYAKHLGFHGVYIDGNMGVLTGYGYDGMPNVPTNDPAEYMKLNARNHQIFSQILKKDNPNFGTWYNWAYAYNEYMLGIGQKCYLGSGREGRRGDQTIRAAAVTNSMFLMEISDTFGKMDSPWTSDASPRHARRQSGSDDAKYAANMVMGYLFPWPEAEQSRGQPLGLADAELFRRPVHRHPASFGGGFVPSTALADSS